jgi:hypothetical protein
VTDARREADHRLRAAVDAVTSARSVKRRTEAVAALRREAEGELARIRHESRHWALRVTTEFVARLATVARSAAGRLVLSVSAKTLDRPGLSQALDMLRKGAAGGTAPDVTKKDASGRVMLFASGYWESSLTDEGRPDAGDFVIYESGKCHFGQYGGAKKQGLWRTWNDESRCQPDEARKAGIKNGEPKFRPHVAEYDELDEFEVFADDTAAPWPTVATALLEKLKPRKSFGWKNDPEFHYSTHTHEANDKDTREFLRAFESAKRRHPEAAGTTELKALSEKASILLALGRLAKKEMEKATPTSTDTGQPLTRQEVAELKSLCEKDGQAQACRQYAQDHTTGALARLDWYERACKLGDGDGCFDAYDQIDRLPPNAKLKERRRDILSAGCKANNAGSNRTSGMCRALEGMNGVRAASDGCDPLTGRHVVSNGPNFSVACEKADGPACVARKVGTGAVSEAQVRAAASSCCCDFH